MHPSVMKQFGSILVWTRNKQEEGNTGIRGNEPAAPEESKAQVCAVPTNGALDQR
jgi:hypothetical protein